MSRELAPCNIVVIALCAGVIDSGQWERRRLANAPHLSLDDFMKPQTEDVPLAAPAKPKSLPMPPASWPPMPPPT